jgi:predicted MFS family arabinose efflux permease
LRAFTPPLKLPASTSKSLGIIRNDGQRVAWRTLRHRNFRYYFMGSVVSDFGTWLQNTAQVLLAYHLAHSALAVGLVTCAQFTSPLVIGPFAGVMTDRIGGRRTLLLTQVAAAAIATALAALEFCHALTESWLIGGALAGGLTFTFALPARNVTVRRLVPAEDTRPAFVMDAVSYNLGRALAPPLTVFIVIATHGYGLAFAANAVTFLFFTLALILAGKTADAEPERRSRVKDGFVIARDSRTIMLLLLMVAAVTIADDPVQVLGPALANHQGVSQSWSGLFIAALGAGSVLGSLRPSRHLPSLRLAATALAALAVCMVVFVSTQWVWVSFGAALAAGVTCLLANSMTRTLLSQTAGANQASVMAVWAIAWAGSKPLASITDGLLAGWIGVRPTGMILAIPAFIPIVALAVRACVTPRHAPPANPTAQPVPTRNVTRLTAPLLPGPLPAPLVSDLLGQFLPMPPTPASRTGQRTLNWTDDNKARVTHNQGWRMADLTPTTSHPGAGPADTPRVGDALWRSGTRDHPCNTGTSTTTPGCSGNVATAHVRQVRHPVHSL